MGTQLVENYCNKDVFSVKRCLLPCDVSIPSPVAWLLTACPRFLQFLPSLPRVPVLRSSFPGEDTSPTFLRSVSGGLSEFPAEVPALRSLLAWDARVGSARGQPWQMPFRGWGQSPPPVPCACWQLCNAEAFSGILATTGTF